MKRLNEITLEQFIDISCGIYDCLGCHSKEEAERQAVKLIFEYKNIVNPGGVRAALIEREDDAKYRSKILLFKLCSALCKMGFIDSVKDVMREYNSSYDKEGEDLIKDISAREREAEYIYKRINETREKGETPTAEEIRASYDSEVAFIMTYFKMPLDTSRVSASVYANIVSQAHREIKMKMARKGA